MNINEYMRHATSMLIQRSERLPPLSVSESIIGEKKNVFQSNQNFIITFRLISSLNPISVSDYGATASVDNKLLIELDPGRLEQLTCVRI